MSLSELSTAQTEKPAQGELSREPSTGADGVGPTQRAEMYIVISKP
jgi:hypothetical protein